MPRSAEHNEVIRAERRDEIFRAAGRVFAKKGFAATKISDIAAEAGLSHGLLYHYFRSKEAVYAALLHELVLTRPTRAAVIGDAASGIERVERTMGRWLEQVTHRPELAVLVAQAFLADALPPSTRQAFLRLARANYRGLVGDIESAQREGDATEEVAPEELAVALISMIRGLALVCFVNAAVSPAHATPSLDTLLRVLRPSTVRNRARPPASISEVGIASGLRVRPSATASRKVARHASRG